MSFQELLDWQWKDYADKHRNHTNLIIHIVAVPLFWLGTLDVVGALLFSGLLHAIGGVLLMGLSLFAQGKGHEMEKNAPAPFTSTPNHVLRVIAEQFVSFPRFVLSGGWYANFTQAS